MTGITLTRHSLDYNTTNPYGAWFLRVTSRSYEPGLSGKIFVYRSAQEKSAYNTGDVFETVASIKQMQDIPEDCPASIEGEQVNYYRSHIFEAYFTTASEVEDAWRIIQEDTRLLINQHRVALYVENYEVVNIQGDVLL
jgi:hypothetical protein